MKSIELFLILAIAFLGLAGGIGYTIYNGAYLITIGIVVLGYLAYPKAKEMFKNLFSDKE